MSRRKTHIDRVLAVAQSQQAAKSPLAASWRRSLNHHGLHPDADTKAPRMGADDLAQARAENADLLAVASGELDRLFRLVGQAGCGVLLSDARGIILDQRLGAGDQGAFVDWGLSMGADWSEAAEGTNGIGTCLAEARRVIIHRDDHFHLRNIAMSCIDAPIWGADGRLIGALDVSSARIDQTEHFNRLIAAMVAQTAAQIETSGFRAAFPKARILVGHDDHAEAAVLLAVDGDDLVIGATRGARRAFDLPLAGRFDAIPAVDLLGRADGKAGFDGAERAVVKRALARARGNVSQAARALGVGRATLYRRMRRLGLDGETSDEGANLSQN